MNAMKKKIGLNDKGQLGIINNKSNLSKFTKICSNVIQLSTSYSLTIIQKGNFF